MSGGEREKGRKRRREREPGDRRERERAADAGGAARVHSGSVREREERGSEQLLKSCGSSHAGSATLSRSFARSLPAFLRESERGTPITEGWHDVMRSLSFALSCFFLASTKERKKREEKKPMLSKALLLLSLSHCRRPQPNGES